MSKKWIYIYVLNSKANYDDDQSNHTIIPTLDSYISQNVHSNQRGCIAQSFAFFVSKKYHRMVTVTHYTNISLTSTYRSYQYFINHQINCPSRSKIIIRNGFCVCVNRKNMIYVCYVIANDTLGEIQGPLMEFVIQYVTYFSYNSHLAFITSYNQISQSVLAGNRPLNHIYEQFMCCYGMVFLEEQVEN